MERNFSTQLLLVTAVTDLTLLFYVYHRYYAENAGIYVETFLEWWFFTYITWKSFFCTKSKSILNVLLPTTLN